MFQAIMSKRKSQLAIALDFFRSAYLCMSVQIFGHGPGLFKEYQPEDVVRSPLLRVQSLISQFSHLYLRIQSSQRLVLLTPSTSS